MQPSSNKQNIILLICSMIVLVRLQTSNGLDNYEKIVKRIGKSRQRNSHQHQIPNDLQIDDYLPPSSSDSLNAAGISFDFDVKPESPSAAVPIHHETTIFNYNSSIARVLALQKPAPPAVQSSSSSSSSNGFSNLQSSLLSPNGGGQTPDLYNDYKSFHFDKILKSSKNALYVTKKEYLRKDWCRTEPLIQYIRVEGCLTKTILNNFCYGQCNSFYIPKGPRNRNRRLRLKGGGTVITNGNNSNMVNGGTSSSSSSSNINSATAGDIDLDAEDLTVPAFRSCTYCKPKRLSWMTVTLKCPALIPQFRRKKVLRIKQCKCIAEALQ